MQAILKAPLYRRPQPTNDIPAMGYLPVGSVVDVDSIVQGKAIDGNNNWIKGKDGFHYWADDSVISKVPIAFDPLKMSWGHQMLEIPTVWAQLATRGKDTVVAVVDSGVVTTNKDLAPNIHPSSRSYIPGDPTLTDIDPDVHGTKMAGIIGATGQNIVYGVAPETQLLIIKVASTKSKNIPLFAQAVSDLADLPVDIVSISSSFPDDDPDFRKAVAKCIAANKIVVASIGNDRSLVGLPEDDDAFPACYNAGFPDNKGVIAVGSFDQQRQLCDFSAWNPHLTFLAPGDFSIRTTGAGETSVMGAQTSIATAFTAGCFALMISYLKLNSRPSPANCARILMDTCDKMGGAAFSHQSGYGRINLTNAINQLKKI